MRGLLREEGGRPLLLECSRLASLLKTCLECGDWGDGTSEICVSTSTPVQGARALGSGTLQWACEGKL